ncbi:hypothetical protein CK203_088899 [Vitis vinifera]|uniref:Uncharacterized protein n=1 Tax=Vitis vinifera TaxID=29760 RepID=A0A438D0P1_VITVI|nr:hypothetical protein CK203_088899 [Vitis vinifera]
MGNRGGEQSPQAHMAKQPKTKENSATGLFNRLRCHRPYDLQSQLFIPIPQAQDNKKIAVANGSLATVAGFGDIYITSTLILKNVLHEQGSGRRIGLAKERSGLYHLESSKQTSNNLSSSFLSSSNKDTIWLYHLRLESESSPIPTGVTRNFPQVLKVYSREKAILEQKQVQESNSDPGNEITIRSDPPLHTQPGETSTNSTDNLDLNLPIVVRKGPENALTDHSIHYHAIVFLSTYHQPTRISL